METFRVKVEVGGRPRRAEVLVNDPRTGVKARFGFELLQVGAARLVSVSFEAASGEEILLLDLRKRLPLGEWGATARRLALQEAEAIRSAQLRPRHSGGGKAGAFARPYEQVAKRYRELVNAGVKHPGPTIAGECGVTPATIRDWLRRCRELGLLEPAPGPGRAGEASRSRSGKSNSTGRRLKGRG